MGTPGFRGESKSTGVKIAPRVTVIRYVKLVTPSCAVQTTVMRLAPKFSGMLPLAVPEATVAVALISVMQEVSAEREPPVVPREVEAYCHLKAPQSCNLVLTTSMHRVTPVGAVEQEALEKVGSYGRQIGHLAEALELIVGILKLLESKELSQQEKDVLQVFLGDVSAIRQIKSLQPKT